MKSTFRRGEIVALRHDPGARGHEQQGPRPAVVLQSDAARWLRTVIVAPTSTSAESAEFRPVVTIRGEPTRVLLEQIKTVDRSRLGRSSGHLAAADLQEVDDALRLILGLI